MNLLSLLTLILVSGRCYGDATSDFNVLQTEFWEWRLQTSPEFATSIGDNRYNDKVTSYNITIYAQRTEQVQGILTKLEQIDPKSLSAADQVNYDILHDGLTTYTTGFKWFEYGTLNPVNFLEGSQTNPGYITSYTPFKTKVDFDNYISRLEQIKTKLEEQTELFNKAIEVKKTLNRVSIERVPGQIDKFIHDDVIHFSLYGPFNATLDNITTIPDDDKKELRERAQEVLLNNVKNPYKAFKTFLEDVYMPKTRADWGVSSWPKGKEFYEACLKWHLSVDTTAEAIHKIGTDEVERISNQMLKVIRTNGFEGSIPEYFQTLKDDPKFKLSTSEEILQEYRDIAFKRVDPKLTSYFKDIPDLPLEVRAFPNDGPGGAYSSGSADGSRPGIFWVNVIRPNQTGNFALAHTCPHFMYIVPRNTFDMMALTLHEASPGHHMQISRALQLTLPDFRRIRITSGRSQIPFNFPSYTAYTEGWGLYAEYMGEEMELYKDDFELLGRYSGEIYRACRLVVDTGLHSLGWEREQAIQYMLNYTSSDRPDIEVEIDRYITWPGQACAYKYGEIKILELRKKAESELGELFDLKEFHGTILRLSSVPLRVLEDAIDKMIAAAKVPRDPGAASTINLSYLTFLLSFALMLLSAH